MLVGARHPGATVGAVEKEFRSEVFSPVLDCCQKRAVTINRDWYMHVFCLLFVFSLCLLSVPMNAIGTPNFQMLFICRFTRYLT